MTYKQVEDYLNKKNVEKRDDGSTVTTIRCEPWLNFFLNFCKEHKDFCEQVLTEDDFEMWFNMYGNGWSDGFCYASKLPWKKE